MSRMLKTRRDGDIAVFHLREAVVNLLKRVCAVEPLDRERVTSHLAQALELGKPALNLICKRGLFVRIRGHLFFPASKQKPRGFLEPQGYQGNRPAL